MSPETKAPDTPSGATTDTDPAIKAQGPRRYSSIPTLPTTADEDTTSGHVDPHAATQMIRIEDLEGGGDPLQKIDGLEANIGETEVKHAAAEIASATDLAMDSPEPRTVRELQAALALLQSPHIPSLGPCTYLIVDLLTIQESTLRDPKALAKLVGEGNAVKDSPQYYVTCDLENHRLLILCNAETSENPIGPAVMRLAEGATGARVYSGTGVVKHKSDGSGFIIEGAPNEATMQHWRMRDPGGYLTTNLAADIIDPGNRKGSLIDITVEETDDPNLVRLIDCKSNVRQTTGGPDKMLGRDSEKAELKDWLTDDESRLVILEGEAGIGKSRLMTETLNELGREESIVCSFTAGDNTIQGSGLVTLAEQLAQKIKSDPIIGAEIPKPAADAQFDWTPEAPAARTTRRGFGERSFEMLTSRLSESGPAPGAVDSSEAVTRIVPIPTEGPEVPDPTVGVTDLLGFNKLNKDQKIKFAQKNPDLLAEMCSDAVTLLTSYGIATSRRFVIEDLHHADGLSEQYVTAIAHQYLHETKDAGGKVLVTMRPEEMYKSEAVKSLEAKVNGFFGPTGTKRKTLEGLDFANDDLAYEYAFRSLPENIRINKRTGEPRTLGTWYKILAKAAGNLPLRMTEFLNAINENPGKNLKIDEDVIEIDKGLLEEIRRIKPTDDLGVFYKGRIDRIPDPETKTILESVALAGGRLTDYQMRLVLTEMVVQQGTALPPDLRQQQHVAELMQGGYLLREDKDDKITYKLQHDTVTDYVVENMDMERRYSSSFYLYGVLRKDTEVHAETRLALIRNIAMDPAPHRAVWSSYERAAKDLLQEADANNSLRKIYGFTDTVLHEHKGIPAVREAVEALVADEAVEDDCLSRLAIRCLMKRAESGMYLGKSSEVGDIAGTTSLHDETTDDGDPIVLRNKGILEMIYENKPELFQQALSEYGKTPQEVIAQIHLIAFQNSYLQSDKMTMKELYENEIAGSSSIPQRTKNLCKIKLLYKQNKFDDAIAMYDSSKTRWETLNEAHLAETGMPHPEYLEALRIGEVRIPFEKIRVRVIRRDGDLGTRGLDEDILPCQYSASPQAKSELHTLARGDGPMLKVLRLEREFSTAFNQYDRMNTLEVIAQWYSMMAHPDHAAGQFSEVWTQADKIEFYSFATRAAKMKGDTQTLKGIMMRDTNEIKEGIKTYSEAGMIALANVSETDFYQAAMRIQRIRGIGRLIQMTDMPTAESGEPIPMEIQQELKPYVQKALSDFAIICKVMKDDKFKGWEGEVAYYASYIIEALELAPRVGVALPSDLRDTSVYQFMDAKNIGLGQAVAATKTDKGICDEVATKRYNLWRWERYVNQPEDDSIYEEEVTPLLASAARE